jgi:hypothetical protein
MLAVATADGLRIDDWVLVRCSNDTGRDSEAVTATHLTSYWHLLNTDTIAAYARHISTTLIQILKTLQTHPLSPSVETTV